MRTNPVVHISNWKRYYLSQADIKHKEVVWPHEKKNNFLAKKKKKKVGDWQRRREESKNQVVVFGHSLQIGRDFSILNSSGSASRDLQSASPYIVEFVKSRLTKTSTNWVGEDVTVIFFQDVLPMTACRISKSSLSKTCCPWFVGRWLRCRVRSRTHLSFLEDCLSAFFFCPKEVEGVWPITEGLTLRWCRSIKIERCRVVALSTEKLLGLESQSYNVPAGPTSSPSTHGTSSGSSSSARHYLSSHRKILIENQTARDPK